MRGPGSRFIRFRKRWRTFNWDRFRESRRPEALVTPSLISRICDVAQPDIRLTPDWIIRLPPDTLVYYVSNTAGTDHAGSRESCRCFI